MTADAPSRIPRPTRERWWGRLIQAHRYLGTVFCVLFAAWFASGIVLIYKRMPRLSTAERLDRLAPLELDLALAGPLEAWRRWGDSGAPVQARLTMSAGRPLFRFLRRSGDWVASFADDGRRLSGVDEVAAEREARRFSPDPNAAIRYLGLVRDSDQWTLSSPIRRLGPLHRFAFTDAQATAVYVTEATGEAVMKTNRASRAWGYAGGVVHWMSFTPLRRHAAVWANLVIYGALLGCLLSSSGIAVGLHRLTLRRRRAGGRLSPYRGWLRWHHYLGLSFGFLTFTWILSGMLSMTPWNVSPGSAPSRAEQEAVAGGPIDLGRFRLTPLAALAAIRRRFEPKELELIQFGGKPFYLAYSARPGAVIGEWENTDEAGYLEPDPGAASVLVQADTDTGQVRDSFTPEELLSAARSAVPGAAVSAITWLTAYDAYYYHRDHGRPLPVLRVKFADREGSWLYLDPRTGSLARHEVARSRIERWLYHGLHSLDFPGFYQSRPWWNAVMLLGSIGGLVLAVTATVIGLRRLRRGVKQLTHIHE